MPSKAAQAALKRVLWQRLGPVLRRTRAWGTGGGRRQQDRSQGAARCTGQIGMQDWRGVELIKNVLAPLDAVRDTKLVEVHYNVWVFYGKKPEREFAETMKFTTLSFVSML